MSAVFRAVLAAGIVITLSATGCGVALGSQGADDGARRSLAPDELGSESANTLGGADQENATPRVQIDAETGQLNWTPTSPANGSPLPPPTRAPGESAESYASRLALAEAAAVLAVPATTTTTSSTTTIPVATTTTIAPTTPIVWPPGAITSICGMSRTTSSWAAFLVRPELATRENAAAIRENLRQYLASAPPAIAPRIRVVVNNLLELISGIEAAGVDPGSGSALLDLRNSSVRQLIADYENRSSTTDLKDSIEFLRVTELLNCAGSGS